MIWTVPASEIVPVVVTVGIVNPLVLVLDIVEVFVADEMIVVVLVELVDTLGLSVTSETVDVVAGALFMVSVVGLIGSSLTYTEALIKRMITATVNVAMITILVFPSIAKLLAPA
jgi:hypothetical protein